MSISYREISYVRFLRMFSCVYLILVLMFFFLAFYMEDNAVDSIFGVFKHLNDGFIIFAFILFSVRPYFAWVIFVLVALFSFVTLLRRNNEIFLSWTMLFFIIFTSFVIILRVISLVFLEYKNELRSSSTIFVSGGWSWIFVEIAKQLLVCGPVVPMTLWWLVRRKERFAPGSCDQCGYPLLGLISCPECGARRVR